MTFTQLLAGQRRSEIGVALPHDGQGTLGEIVVESGAIDDWSFMASCRVEGQSSAIFAMNRPRDFVRARLERRGALA